MFRSLAPALAWCALCLLPECRAAGELHDPRGLVRPRQRPRERARAGVRRRVPVHLERGTHAQSERIRHRLPGIGRVRRVGALRGGRVAARRYPARWTAASPRLRRRHRTLADFERRMGDAVRGPHHGGQPRAHAALPGPLHAAYLRAAVRGAGRVPSRLAPGARRCARARPGRRALRSARPSAADDGAFRRRRPPRRRGAADRRGRRGRTACGKETQPSAKSDAGRLLRARCRVDFGRRGGRRGRSCVRGCTVWTRSGASGTKR